MLKCEYCDVELTEEEIKNIAEAEDMTPEQLAETSGVELMCDKCAEGE